MEELQPVHFPLHPARRILNDTEQLKYSMLKYSSLQTGTLKLGIMDWRLSESSTADNGLS